MHRLGMRPTAGLMSKLIIWPGNESTIWPAPLMHGLGMSPSIDYTAFKCPETQLIILHSSALTHCDRECHCGFLVCRWFVEQSQPPVTFPVENDTHSTGMTPALPFISTHRQTNTHTQSNTMKWLIHKPSAGVSWALSPDEPKRVVIWLVRTTCTQYDMWPVRLN